MAVSISAVLPAVSECTANISALVASAWAWAKKLFDKPCDHAGWHETEDGSCPQCQEYIAGK